MTRNLNRIFIILCFIAFTLPALFAHRETGRIAEDENRYYANPPVLFTDAGRINPDFPTCYDSWISDNIRLRSVLIRLNATLRYRLFRRIARADEQIGADGELFFTDDSHLDSYLRRDVLSQEALEEYLDALQWMSDHFDGQGISLYYIQCVMKENLYPERYPAGAPRPSAPSAAEQIIRGIDEQTTVRQIHVRDKLTAHSGERIFYTVTDPGHWNEYGAFLGFSEMIDRVRVDYPEVRPADLADYVCEEDHSLARICGMPYPVPEDSIHCVLKHPKAVEISLPELDPELDRRIAFREHTHYFSCDAAGNNLRILLVGDSFLRMGIKNMVAEHFAETLSIDWLNADKLDEITALWHPDLIILEKVEDAELMETFEELVKRGAG